jgi:hypothetical protein
MEYPRGFPPDLLKQVENERTSAELQLRDAVSKRENVLEEARRFVERIFLEFVRQACEAERRSFWTSVDARPVVDWFLTDQLIPEAYRLAYPGLITPSLDLEEFRTRVNEEGRLWISYLEVWRDHLASASSRRDQPADDRHNLGKDAGKQGDDTEETSDTRAMAASIDVQGTRESGVGESEPVAPLISARKPPAKDSGDSRAGARRAFVEPKLKAQNMSGLEWASAAKVDYHTVQDYLSGKTRPRLNTRTKLAKALNEPLDDLPE